MLCGACLEPQLAAFCLLGLSQSTAIICRLLLARAQGDQVHQSFKVSGLLVIILAITFALPDKQRGPNRNR